MAMINKPHAIPVRYLRISATMRFLPGPLLTKRCCLIDIAIPIINIRWSDDHVRFIMGIPIWIGQRILSE